MSAPEPTTSPPRRWGPEAAIGVVIVIGLAILAAILWRGGQSAGTIRGRVLGSAERVVLVDPQRGVLRDAPLESDGSYTIPIPHAAFEPWIAIHGPAGSRIETGVLPAAQEEIEVPLLALWQSPLRVQGDEKVLRIDWSPIPKGEGFPAQSRYSVLFTYTKTGGDRGETSFLSLGNALEIARTELFDLLNARDLRIPEVELSVRAFDPSDLAGPRWVAVTEIVKID